MGGTSRGKAGSVLSGEWKGYKEVWVGCTGQGCSVWQQVRVKGDWKTDEEKVFFWGLCAGVEMEKMRMRVEKLEKEKEDLARKVQVGREEEYKSYKEALVQAQRGAVEEAKREVEDGKVELIKEMRREVRRSVDEEGKKRRVMVFGLKTNGSSVERGVEGVLKTIGVESKPCRVTQFKRGKDAKEGWVAPIMIEFDTEREQREVLARKVMLKKDEEYQQVFLERDMTLEEREEKKRRWVLEMLKRRRKEEEMERQTEQMNGRTTIAITREDQLKESEETKVKEVY